MAVAESVEKQADSFVHSSHRLLIDGEWVEAASGKTFETLNPASEDVLAEVAHGEAEDVARAVKAARKAFADGSPWRRMNPSDRGRLIWRVSELIEQHADELAMLDTLANGKPYSVARAADVPPAEMVACPAVALPPSPLWRRLRLSSLWQTQRTPCAPFLPPPQLAARQKS